ncbi:Tetratricopeptide TPR_2 repeat protein [Xanthobacter versatilis]|uniref:Tetratricopeptide TPR_2 repeat protein n=1 Tax=Xanthobacter autotrophicus (strain ATCC BAA-1158 / Py2) TaxID=78245 RepID=A7IHP8_XANP2|nr:Tetratricopeptide TPR_2 repeat protein [Xanthobacter autotrophicus Py2]
MVERTPKGCEPEAVMDLDHSAPPEDMPPGDNEALLVRAALERVLAAPDFAASPRLAAFLRFVVEATLDGRADEIKGYTIAVEALGRPPSFDPQSDPIVRVEATRLRRALERYYTTVGAEDPLVIDIPKGGYVPLFRPRTDPPAEPAPAEPEPQPAPIVPEAPRPTPTWQRTWPRMAAAAMAVVLIAGLGLLAPRLSPFKSDHGAALADRIRLPVVEVRPFEASGPGAPADAELRAIEEQMRDAFARFDFVEVKAASATTHESGVPEICSGPQSRSVFALAGLAEGRTDGTFSLITRVIDRCDGSIIWSASVDGLAQGTALGTSERRVVHDVAIAIMESYGVIPVRARAQALAKAPGSGYGCIASAIAYIRGDPQGQRGNGTACLAELTRQERDFALGYAVRATAQLYATLHDDTPNPTAEEMEEFLDEAERAAELAPASAYAARTLALVQLFAGEPDDAITTAEKALKLNPLDFDVAATVASVFIGAGRVEEGEGMLMRARREGAVRTNLQDAFLGMAAFMRDDVLAAQALVPQLTLHSAIENKLALALCLHTLGRMSDEREVVGALLHRMPDGAEGVRRLVRRMLPAPGLADKALAALETAGLSREAVAGKPPRG